MICGFLQLGHFGAMARHRREVRPAMAELQLIRAEQNVDITPDVDDAGGWNGFVAEAYRLVAENGGCTDELPIPETHADDRSLESLETDTIVEPPDEPAWFDHFGPGGTVEQQLLPFVQDVTPGTFLTAAAHATHFALAPGHFLWNGACRWLQPRLTLGWIVENVFTLEYHGDRTNTELFYTDEWWGESRGMPRTNHSHGLAAEARYHATKSFSNFAEMADLERYDVSSSRREAHHLGERNFHNVKDMLLRAKKDTMPSKPLVTFVDVVDYLTPNEMAFHCFNRNVMLYNIQPPAMSGTTKNSVYWFDTPTTVCEQVNGGGGGLPYSHPCWYFGTDVVVMKEGGNWYDVFGMDVIRALRRLIFPRYCIYEVCRRGHGTDGFRQVVYLRPARVVWDFCGLMASRFDYEGHQLRRVTAVSKDGEWGSLLTMGKPVQGKPRMVRSVARFGSRVSVEVSETHWQTLCSREYDQVSKSGVVVADAAGALSGAPLEQAKAPFLTAAIKKIGRQETPLLVTLHEVRDVVGSSETCIESGGIARYEMQVSDATEGEVKLCGREVGPSTVTTPACIPVQSNQNDKVCVAERIENVANNTNDPVLESYIDEFVDLVVAASERGQCYPLSPAQVDDHQTKPTQKQRNDFARDRTFISNYLDGTLQLRASSFQKQEFYAGFKPPRNITNVRDEMNFQTARFTIPLKLKILKRYRWFGPGKSPRDTELAVKKMLTNRVGVVATDYSKFDGTLSDQLKSIYFRIMLKAFDTGYASDIKNLWKCDSHNSVKTANGESYNSGSGQMSGSGTTSDSNTVINAFIQYVGARLSGSESPAAAFGRIGLAYGDDGLCHPSLRMDAAARMAGLKLTRDSYKKGDCVPYLGRRWVIMGDNVVSFAEPQRTLEKLHVSTRSANVTDRVARIDRAIGYIISDGHVPVIGDYCARVLELDKYDPDEPLQLSPDTIFRMVNAKYFSKDETYPDILAVFSKVLGVPVADLAGYIAGLKRANKLEDFPAPLHTRKNEPPKWRTRVNDEIVKGIGGRHPGRNNRATHREKPAEKKKE